MAEKKSSETTAAISTVTFNEGLAAIRNLSPISHETIPVVDDHFKPLAAEVKKPILKMAEEQRAEAGEALLSLFSKPDQIVADLGPFAPDAAKAKALHARFKEDRLVLERAAQLHAFAEEREDVTNHDVLVFLNEAQKDIERLIEKKPALADRYGAVLKLKQQRGAAIADGLARKKEAAAAGGEETGGGGK